MKSPLLRFLSIICLTLSLLGQVSSAAGDEEKGEKTGNKVDISGLPVDPLTLIDSYLDNQGSVRFSCVNKAMHQAVKSQLNERELLKRIHELEKWNREENIHTTWNGRENKRDKVWEDMDYSCRVYDLSLDPAFAEGITQIRGSGSCAEEISLLDRAKLGCYGEDDIEKFKNYVDRPLKFSIRFDLVHVFNDLVNSGRMGPDTRCREKILENGYFFGLFGANKILLAATKLLETLPSPGNLPPKPQDIFRRDGRSTLNAVAHRGNAEYLEYAYNLIRNSPEEVEQMAQDLKQDDDPALDAAVLSNYTGVVKFLLEKFPNHFNKSILRDRKFEDAMHNAIRHERNDFIDYMHEQGVPLNTKGWHGYTTFDYAIRYGHISTAKKLVDYGVPVNKKILEEALAKGWLTPEQVQSFSKLDETGMTLAHQAMVNKDLNLVKRIHANGSDFSALDVNGFTPVDLAAGTGYLEGIQFLRAQNIPLNKPDRNKNIPLHFAAESGHDDVVAYLIASSVGKAGINLKNKEGDTPLSLALKNVKLETSKMLIENGAKFEKKFIKTESTTLVHEAASNGNTQMLELLAGIHANLNEKNVAKETPLMEAIKSRHTPIAAFLINRIPRSELKPSSADGRKLLQLIGKFYGPDHFLEEMLKGKGKAKR